MVFHFLTFIYYDYVLHFGMISARLDVTSKTTDDYVLQFGMISARLDDTLKTTEQIRFK